MQICFLALPTLALPTSGSRVEIPNFLSACLQAPLCYIHFPQYITVIPSCQDISWKIISKTLDKPKIMWYTVTVVNTGV